jgi:hypothetical protein
MRLLRGLIGAALFAVIGWLAAQLTVGMLLARHLNSAQHAALELAWLFSCPAAGFIAGCCLDPQRLTNRVGWICWGATFGLGILTIVTRLPIALIPGADKWSFVVPMLSQRVSLEEAGFVSAPAALLLGGLLGWYFFRQEEREQSPPNLGEPTAADGSTESV